LNKLNSYSYLSKLKFPKLFFTLLFVLFLSNYAYDFVQLVCYDNTNDICSIMGDFNSENNSDQESESENETETEETDTFDEFMSNIFKNSTNFNQVLCRLNDFNQNHLSVFIDIPIPPPKVS
jgi:hypothetical protein